MKLIRRLLYREIVQAVLLVCLGFLLLFAFFDVIEELGRAKDSVGGTGRAFMVVATLMPGHLYDLLPISVLIGTIFVLSRYAMSSEFTIMRTSGLGPVRALGILLSLGLLFSVFTFVFGDYVAPASNRLSEWVQSGGKTTTGSGRSAWLRDTQDGHNSIIRVGTVDGQERAQDIQILQFDAQGRLQRDVRAREAEFAPEHWLLREVRQTQYPLDVRGSVQTQELAQLAWPTQITSAMVSTALIKPERMGALDLYRYTQHLKANEQNAREYEIALWRKLIYPLGCLVMVMLALPFAYLHHRSTGTAGYVFMGVMIGIGYYLFNNVSNHIGNLHGWVPWFAAALPSLVFGAVSLGAFIWLVLKR